jgi:hypothetical protein
MKRALALLAFVASVQAGTLAQHVGTRHFAAAVPNDDNPGLTYQSDSGLILGAYRNSYGRNTVHAGYIIERGPWSVSIGAATGYKGACERWCRTITPMIVPSYRLRLDSALAVRLSVPNGQGVHLTVEKPL